ncbi:MAG: TRAP transporter fused permease subunit [Thermodesulfobacteriota bacterium]
MEHRSAIASRYRELTGFWHWFTVVLSAVGLAVAIYHIFYFTVGGFMFMENSYLYLLMAIYLSMAFLFFPMTKKGPQKLIMAIDVLLSFTIMVITLYLAYQGYTIIERGWGYFAPTHVTVMAVIMWVLAIEAVRRTAGTSLAVVITVFSLYPLYARYMPGFMEGYGRSFATTANFHALSMESLLGIPLTVFGVILIGFIVFGVAMQSSGGGNFFLKLSSALLGSTRGGTAKVAVLSSALFGTLSGSVISNVVTTGAITIPAMKKTGYPPHYAGAIECASSTGGTLMPPIMGATAFVMAAFLGISYGTVALAAAIPSVLAYLGLLLQVDGYAGRNGLMGLPKSELPTVREALKEGWFYLFGIALLLYILFVIRLESQAPFWAILPLLICAMFRKETRFTWKSFLEFIQQSGKLLCELIAILAGVGMILGALSLTGVAASFAREIVALAGGSMYLMLLFGAVASFILGMGMTITACYVFLALVLVPGLVMVGLNEIAVHLYVMYWGMLSFITPPVALAAFPAAVIANANPARVGFTAMKLGWVKYVVPVFFVLDPALVFQAPWPLVVQAAISTTIGVFLMASVLENYMVGIGKLRLGTLDGTIVCALLFGGGFMMGLPGWSMDFGGAAVALLGLALIFISRKLRGEGREVVTA